ncbi:hypothetical protein EK904_003446 [Melospiza melodia maxima]|nr:hypothetical protein EK904_003446 [Melospiza melodia maxima]
MQTFSHDGSSSPSQTLVLVQPAPISMRLFLLLPSPSPWQVDRSQGMQLQGHDQRCPPCWGMTRETPEEEQQKAGEECSWRGSSALCQALPVTHSPKGTGPGVLQLLSLETSTSSGRKTKQVHECCWPWMVQSGTMASTHPTLGELSLDPCAEPPVPHLDFVPQRKECPYPQLEESAPVEEDRQECGSSWATATDIVCSPKWQAILMTCLQKVPDEQETIQFLLQVQAEEMALHQSAVQFNPVQ